MSLGNDLFSQRMTALARAGLLDTAMTKEGWIPIGVGSPDDGAAIWVIVRKLTGEYVVDFGVIFFAYAFIDCKKTLCIHISRTENPDRDFIWPPDDITHWKKAEEPKLPEKFLAMNFKFQCDGLMKICKL